MIKKEKYPKLRFGNISRNAVQPGKDLYHAEKNHCPVLPPRSEKNLPPAGTGTLLSAGTAVQMIFDTKCEK